MRCCFSSCHSLSCSALLRPNLYGGHVGGVGHADRLQRTKYPSEMKETCLQRTHTSRRDMIVTSTGWEINDVLEDVFTLVHSECTFAETCPGKLGWNALAVYCHFNNDTTTGFPSCCSPEEILNISRRRFLDDKTRSPPEHTVCRSHSPFFRSGGAQTTISSRTRRKTPRRPRERTDRPTSTTVWYILLNTNIAEVAAALLAPPEFDKNSWCPQVSSRSTRRAQHKPHVWSSGLLCT